MLYIRHLTKYYTKSKPIISDMNLSFPSKGLNIIVGKSGCGKTTLLNMIGSMDQNYIGSIELDGVELSTMNYKNVSDYRNYDSAYIFQINSLFEHLTVKQNIQLVLDLQAKDADIEDILEKVGLKGFSNKKVKYLSGGERQRVGIARALIKDSKIILADEPTSALDSKNGHRILALLKEISKEKLVIIVTHDTKKAFQYADRIIKLVDGKVVEDDIINQVDGTVNEVKRSAPRARLLRPIFFDQLKKSLIINLFIILLISAALGVYGIAKEQAKIKNEYDKYYELKEDENPKVELEFNDLRTLTTHEANKIDLYNVIKATEGDDAYKYFKEVANPKNNLEQTDYDKLESLLGDYNLNYNDSKYGGLIIKGISKELRPQVSIGGIAHYWYEPQRTNYVHYLYDENNQYNLLHGTIPKADDEILITDTIADHYLRNNKLDSSDLSVLINNELVINDIRGESGRDLTTSNANIYYDQTITYLHSIPTPFKIVGIIDTRQLDYYTFDTSANRYFLVNKIVKQTENNEYMNSTYFQPYGYVVLNKELNAAKTNPLYDIPLSLNRIIYDGQKLNTGYVSTFTGYNDYRGFLGFEDNLEIDYNSRLYIKNEGLTNLTGNQIIISRELLRLFDKTSYWGTTQIINNYETMIKGKSIKLTFETLQGLLEVEFEIVGVSRNSSSLFYVSNEVYDLIKHANTEKNNVALTLGLEGVSARERIKVIKELREEGYLLTPVQVSPGSYLEFVPTQGEIETVDKMGYPVETNISLYHLFSEHYNTKDMISMNSILEIVNSIYTFCLIMAFTLSLGFIYLKEKRQKMNIMKLTQIGVSSKSIILINFIMYAFVAFAIGAVTYFATNYAINYINDVFALKIGSGVIYRFRLLLTNTTLLISIVSVVIMLVVGIISSVWIVKKSRR